MTLADERTRALVWAGGFPIELARGKSLPLRVRQQAVDIARHFPTHAAVSDGSNAHRLEEPSTAHSNSSVPWSTSS